MLTCHRRLGAIVMTVALVAASCGSSGGDSSSGVDGELLPFEQVQASEFVFEADPTNFERGIFRVTTTEPMICTIVWGETEAFGNFNNSLDMNGTGIIDHNVFLPRAEPGTTYFFRVQGSTADGNQYRSETGLFTIPEPGTDAAASGDDMADEVVTRGENLALGATVVAASSVFGSGWAAENAIDDDLTTEWATQGDGDDGFITIDLGDTRDVAGVEFITRSMLDGTAVTDLFRVTVDGGDTFGPFAAGTPAQPNFADLVFSGREIRFDVLTSTGGNVGAVEVRVFAPA